MKNLQCFYRRGHFLLFFSVLLWTANVSAEIASQVVSGTEGWLFLEQELRFLNTGPFWGDYAKTASRADRADAKDPTPAITAFHRALAEKNIILLLVPVPPKALIYAEHVPDSKKNKEWGASLDQYYKILRDKGVRVLDLREDFYAQKKNQEKPLYCREDTHWSGFGATVAANRIADEVVKVVPKGTVKFTGKWSDREITGDLRQMLGGSEQQQKEVVSIQEIIDASGRWPEPDASSPILVLGDSHVLVFHAGGDMHAKGGGISDQLSFVLARPIDVLGVRGSGATPARLSLYRKAQRMPDYWVGKKVVVWCFAAREFTETDGWRVLPIEP